MATCAGCFAGLHPRTLVLTENVGQGVDAFLSMDAAFDIVLDGDAFALVFTYLGFLVHC